MIQRDEYMRVVAENIGLRKQVTFYMEKLLKEDRFEMHKSETSLPLERDKDV
jgi:hypothetical protein|tara:strand:- start:172 stop:327 length:156 start_codon:yes stop_codon:yes gene_type:complete